MFDLQKKLSGSAEKVLAKKYGVSDKVIFAISGREGRGDMTSSIALQLAKKLKKKSQDIAGDIIQAIESIDGVEKADVAGPGYVNVTLASSVLIGTLPSILSASKPLMPKKKGSPVIVEYSQPNIAKPLGAHHLIGTVIGQAIANLYRHKGFPVICWNYLGDWGTQFGKLAVAYKKWGVKPIRDYSVDELLALYVRFHSECKNDNNLEDEGRQAFRELEKGDKKLRAFWKEVVSITKASLEELYNRLHVSFDTDQGESFYEDKMDDILADGIRSGVIEEGEGGALIVKFSEISKLPPYLIRKGDGATLYSTRDLAQMKYRIDEYHPQTILILTDIAQKLHFEQLVATCTMLGWKLPEFENVLFGRMRFTDKSMSTRKGNILKLEEVLDEAVSRADALIEEKRSEISSDERAELREMMGVGAVVYGILSQNRKMDMVFDWSKMLTLEGNSAPYLQYTHARARSVLRKAGEEGGIDVTYDGTLTSRERTLILHLALFPETVETARAECLPHRLATYLYELSQAFNSFYNADPILAADKDIRSARLTLTSLTATVLKTGAELLTLRVPEHM